MDPVLTPHCPTAALDSIFHFNFGALTYVLSHLSESF